ncbi:MAG: hypothetical protein U1G05_15030, partial [Kiritimatiellia bacterium]
MKIDDLGDDTADLPFYKPDALDLPEPFKIPFHFNNPGLKPETGGQGPLGLASAPPSGPDELSSARQEMMRSIQGQNWTEAIADVQRALAIAPQDAELNRKAGMLYAMTGSFHLADTHLRVAVLANPRDVAALSAWAYVLFSLARFENSLAIARRCETLAPRRLHTQYTLSCLAVAMGGDRANLAFWRRVSLIEQITVATWLQTDRKELLEVLGTERYAELCGLVLGKNSHENMVLIPDSLRSGRDAFLKGDWPGALIYFNLARDYGVDGVFIGQHIARCQFEMGRSLDSMRILNDLSITYPDVAEVWYNLGYVLTQTGAYNEGSQAFERAMGLVPNEPLYSFAWACAKAGHGKLDEAWPTLQRLDREQPG